MGPDLAAQLFGKLLGKEDTVALNHDVEIEILDVEQEVADKAADRVSRPFVFPGNLADRSEQDNHILGQSFDQQAVNIAVPHGVGLICLGQ